MLVRSVRNEAQAVAVALEERAVPHRMVGAAAFFQRAEIRDVLAWLRLLTDPGDAGAVVRALARAPIELRAVDLARCTQIARRRKLDMVSALVAATESPQIPPEARERILAFLKLYRAAAASLDTVRPDLYVHRLVERLGLRRQQLFAAQADVVERLVNLAKLAELARGYVARAPQATAREFARYIAAVAEAGLREEEATVEVARRRGLADGDGRRARARVRPRVRARAALGAHAGGAADGGRAARPTRCCARSCRPTTGATTTSTEMRRLLHVAMTRARERLVLAYPAGSGTESDAEHPPSPFAEEARAAVGGGVGGARRGALRPRRGAARDVPHAARRGAREPRPRGRAAGRAALRHRPRRRPRGRALPRAAQARRADRAARRAERRRRAARAQRAPAAGGALRCSARSSRPPRWTSTCSTPSATSAAAPARSPRARSPRSRPSSRAAATGSCSPRRTSRPTACARCATSSRASSASRASRRSTSASGSSSTRCSSASTPAAGRAGCPELLGLLDAGWRRGGFGDSDEEVQLRGKAEAALTRYRERIEGDPAEPMWFERAFAFRLGPHLLRGRVDRVDRLPDGGFELIDYKTGRPKTAAQLKDDVQLSLYAVGAREAWQLEAAHQAYYYVLDDEKVPVRPRRGRPRVDHRHRARGRRGNPLAGLRADAVLRGLLVLRLPHHLPGGGALMADVRAAWRSGWFDALGAGTYDFVVERERLARRLGRLVWGTDMGLLYERLGAISATPDGSAILDVPCGGGLAFRALRPDQRRPLRRRRPVARDAAPGAARGGDGEAWTRSSSSRPTSSRCRSTTRASTCASRSTASTASPTRAPRCARWPAACVRTAG